MNLWLPLLVACAGSYVIKLAGLSLPETALAHPKVHRVAGLLPVALLAALVVTELFDSGGRYAVDWRTLAGVGAGVIALLLRRGFLMVFVTAVAVSAALRMLS